MTTPVLAPRWALEKIKAHLGRADELVTAELVGRNLVLAHTRRGSVVVHKSFWLGTTCATVAYPPGLAWRQHREEVAEEPSPPRQVRAPVQPPHEEAQEEAVVPPQPTPEPVAAPSDGSFREGAYTLHVRQTGGKPVYFFSKGTSAAGTPSALPPGYLVGRNSRTGLPYLKADPSYVPEETPLGRDSTRRYAGDVHKVIDVEGIGKKIAAQLNAVGVMDTDELCRSDPSELSEAVGLGKATIELWQSMGELMKVAGIGKQYAEVLAYAGVKGIDDLKARSAAGIARATNAYTASQKHKPIGKELTPKRVESWQATARRMRKSTVALFHPTPAPALTVASAAKTDAVLAGLDPMQGDVKVQWDTAPQLAGERSRHAAAAEGAVVMGGKGNEVRIDVKPEPAAAPEPVAAAAPAPSMRSAPDGVEVHFAGRKAAPAPAPAAAPAARPAPEPEKAVDGTLIEVVKAKGGLVKSL
ncbi:MAG: DUF4332 domain-containing protein [Thermoplasmatota archaeon]